MLRFLVAITVVAFVSVSTSSLAAQVRINTAQSKKSQKSDPKKDIHAAIEAGPGVHVVKRDDKGRIQTCLVVGEARISTVLGKAQGLLNAKKQARLKCEAEFVKWIKTSVDVHAKNENEMVLFLEGSQENDKETLKESGKSIDKTSESIQTAAKGLVRGFEPVFQDADTKGRIYTLVVRWSAQNVTAAKAVQKDN